MSTFVTNSHYHLVRVYGILAWYGATNVTAVVGNLQLFQNELFQHVFMFQECFVFLLQCVLLLYWCWDVGVAASCCTGNTWALISCQCSRKCSI
jgi:hypothetical protein